MLRFELLQHFMAGTTLQEIILQSDALAHPAQRSQEMLHFAACVAEAVPRLLEEPIDLVCITTNFHKSFVRLVNSNADNPKLMEF